MDFGFVRIYYLKEIAECRSSVPGWKFTGDFLRLSINRRRGGAARRRNERMSVPDEPAKLTGLLREPQRSCGKGTMLCLFTDNNSEMTSPEPHSLLS